MTHTKKLTIFFLAFATLFTFILHLCFYQPNVTDLIFDSFSPLFGELIPVSTEDSSTLSASLSSKLLRFRVLADSDSSQDQADKRALCAKLIPLLSDELSKVQTKEEAVTLMRESLPFLTAYCNDLLSSSGKSVSCSLGSHLFPYKTYGNYQFPAGTYDTLLVTIGSGSGSNWWCLAFPPLCFADEAFVDVPDSSKQMLSDILDDNEYDAIVLDSARGQFMPDPDPEKTNKKKFFFYFSSLLF